MDDKKQVLVVGNDRPEIAMTAGMRLNALTGMLQMPLTIMRYDIPDIPLLPAPEPKYSRVAQVPSGHVRTKKDKNKRKQAKAARKRNRRNRRK